MEKKGGAGNMGRVFKRKVLKDECRRRCKIIQGDVTIGSSSAFLCLKRVNLFINMPVSVDQDSTGH